MNGLSVGVALVVWGLVCCVVGYGVGFVCGLAAVEMPEEVEGI
jgi:hypothetical protein